MTLSAQKIFHKNACPYIEAFRVMKAAPVYIQHVLDMHTISQLPLITGHKSTFSYQKIVL